MPSDIHKVIKGPLFVIYEVLPRLLFYTAYIAKTKLRRKQTSILLTLNPSGAEAEYVEALI